MRLSKHVTKYKYSLSNTIYFIFKIVFQSNPGISPSGQTKNNKTVDTIVRTRKHTRSEKKFPLLIFFPFLVFVGVCKL